MGPDALAVLPGTALAVACAVVVGVVACVGAWTVRRAAVRRRAALDAELARSRDEVDQLCRKVDELSDEVVRARRAAEADREYVITSLGADTGNPDTEGERRSGLPVSMRHGAAVPHRRSLTRVVEDQLVQALARQPRTSSSRARAVELVVRTVSLGHGVRRALSADVLDRASAEALVARRRSRRERRRQVRAARRLVREDRTSGRDVA